MNHRWDLRSVRLRLTLCHVGAMMLVLALYAAGVFSVVSRNASNALNDELRSDFRWAAEMVDQRPDGTFTWFQANDPNGNQDGPWLQVWSDSGELLYRTAVAARNPFAESHDLASKPDGRIVPVPAPFGTFRALTERWTIAGRSVVIQVVRSEASMRQELKELVLILVLGLPLGVVVSGFGGYSLARRALVPVERMAERAQSITADRLSERLPVDNPQDELGRLASVFNLTLGRLESSFEQMRRFTADVSHELRTPLTAIRSVGEVGLRERRDDAAYRAIIGSMLEEVDRLTCLVDRLLSLSRAETGQAKLSVEIFELGELAEEVVAHLGVLAEEKQQSITIERHGLARSRGDRLVLRQALINLVDNAIKFTPAGGHICIRVSDSAEGATLDVTDTGPGIATKQPEQIFDRFYRDEKSQAFETRGSGLGLSIAKWAVEVSGGRLSLKTGQGVGSTFRITLPSLGDIRT